VTQSILGGLNGTQWTKTYTDLAGRVVKTEYPDGAIATRKYHLATAALGIRGKLFWTYDLDENATANSGSKVFYLYNAKGEQFKTVEPMADSHTRTTITEGTTIAPAIRTTTSSDGIKRRDYYADNQLAASMLRAELISYDFSTLRS